MIEFRRLVLGPAMLALILSAGGCSRMPPLKADEIRVSGKVLKAQVGVNCWQLQGSDGTNYELRPDQAPAGILAEGKAVTLVLKPRPDLMSSCQVGQIADVVRSEE